VAQSEKDTRFRNAALIFKILQYIDNDVDEVLDFIFIMLIEMSCKVGILFFFLPMRKN
jgi:glutaminase